MTNREKSQSKREQAAAKAARQTSALVRGIQAGAYGLILEWLSGNIETEGGQIKYTARNLGRVQGLSRLFRKIQKDYQKTMLGAVLEWVGDIVGLNREYFEVFDTPAESVEEAARRITLQRWGYNVNTGELISGGYFETLFSNADTARRVAGLVNRAIAAKMPMAEFQKLFRRAFVGNVGQGMLERHWNTNSFDLFQRIDRTANLVYADRLGLNYAIYSGTLKDTSRPFCVERVNKVYSRKEIESWKNLEFEGKPAIGYDPFFDCGGFNCRHHLSFISDEIAAVLRPEIE